MSRSKESMADENGSDRQEQTFAGASYARFNQDRYADSSKSIAQKYTHELRKHLTAAITTDTVIALGGAYTFFAHTIASSPENMALFAATLLAPLAWSLLQFKKYHSLIQQADKEANIYRDMADASHLASQQLERPFRSHN